MKTNCKSCDEPMKWWQTALMIHLLISAIVGTVVIIFWVTGGIINHTKDHSGELWTKGEATQFREKIYRDINENGKIIDLTLKEMGLSRNCNAVSEVMSGFMILGKKCDLKEIK